MSGVSAAHLGEQANFVTVTVSPAAFHGAADLMFVVVFFGVGISFDLVLYLLCSCFNVPHPVPYRCANFSERK